MKRTASTAGFRRRSERGRPEAAITEDDRKWLEARFARLERRIWLAMLAAVALSVVTVELFELASP